MNMNLAIPGPGTDQQTWWEPVTGRPIIEYSAVTGKWVNTETGNDFDPTVLSLAAGFCGR